MRGGLDLGGTGTLSSAYAQHRWLPSERFDVTVGLRGSAYDQTDDLYWEPRASAQFKVTDRVRLKGAWGQYHQFVKRVENEDVLEGSRDFWVLAGDDLDPSFAEHRIVGASYDDGDWLFDVEAYQKDLDGVSQFSTRLRRTPDQALDNLFFSGIGEARGVEFLVQKKRGRLTGWVGYTLSEVEYELADFNDGNPFPASHDQLSEFKSVLMYQAGPWTLSSTWVYGSGKPYTIPEARYPWRTSPPAPETILSNVSRCRRRALRATSSSSCIMVVYPTTSVNITAVSRRLRSSVMPQTCSSDQRTASRSPTATPTAAPARTARSR